MSENNTENLETTEEVAENVTDTVTEEVTDEVVENAADEVTEEVDGVVTENGADEVTEEDTDEVEEDAADTVTEEVTDEVTENVTDEVTETPAPKKTGKIIAIIVAAVAAVAIIAVVLSEVGLVKNPYEWGYTDTTGVNLDELADQSGVSLKEYKELRGIPKMMPGSTFENAVNNNIKISKILELGGGTFDELKETFGWDDSITENSTVGEAIDKTTLRNYVGEDQFETFKEIYGLTDITLDTYFGEIRKQVETFEKEERIKAEKGETDDKSESNESEDMSKDAETPEAE